MKVKLLQITPDPIDVMWTAARTCYSAKSPVEMWEDWQRLLDPDNEEVVCDFNEYTNKKDKHWNLVKKVLDSGHQSVAEHVYFTFAIEGISRACSHQLVRHRAGIVFSQQSQRYVEIKEDIDELGDAFSGNYDSANFKESKIYKILSKYFTEVNFKTVNGYFYALDSYLYAINNGEKPEDARRFLPNAVKTNITLSVNYRELIHICNLRLCSRAQKEIRELFTLIRNIVENSEPKLAEYLIPQCEVHGICYEHKCCGRKPTLKDIMDDYYSDRISKEDLDMIFGKDNESEPNAKLLELLKMKSVLDGN